MGKKRSVSELLRLACIHAEQDLVGLVDAWGENAPEAQDHKQLLAEIRSYRLRRWGRTTFEKALDGMKPTTIGEVIRQHEERQ